MTNQPWTNKIPAKRPIVGVSASRYNTESVHRTMMMLREAGAQPVFLGDHIERVLGETADAELRQYKSDQQKNEYISMALEQAREKAQRVAMRDVSQLNGIVILGNDESDVNPDDYVKRYEYLTPERSRHPETKSEMDYSPEAAVRSVYETTLIKLANASGIPMLGVCAGAQRINVALGGGMVQHVPDLVGHEEHSQEPFGLPPTQAVHPVVLSRDSRADAIAQKANAGKFDAQERYIIQENSRHHQAIDPNKLGDGLKVTGWVENRVERWHEPVKTVEVIESTAPNRWLVATQFHPEYEASSFGKALLEEFTAASKQFAHDNPLPQKPEWKTKIPLPLYAPITQQKPVREDGWVAAAAKKAGADHSSPAAEGQRGRNN